MKSEMNTSWTAKLRRRYVAGEASLFLLHGNVRDLQPLEHDDGSTQWTDLRSALQRLLQNGRDLVVYHNLSQGFVLARPEDEQTLLDIYNHGAAAHHLAPRTSLPKRLRDVITFVEQLITNPDRPIGVVLDFFEMVAPRKGIAMLNEEDRANLVALQRWANTPSFRDTNNAVVLITEHLSDVSSRFLGSPQLATIPVPFPDRDLRERYLAGLQTPPPMDMPAEVFVQATSGLSILQIQGLLQSASVHSETIGFDTLIERKKQIIEQTCHGLVELVAPRHDFSHVGGMDPIKGVLRDVAEAVRGGHTAQVPMGMIFVGPMGTGKTFVAEAFARESGLTCLKLGNFRERWVGSTESNLERVLDLIEALGFVLLIIDEADRTLSTGSSSDGGVNSRVIARLKEFMSKTSHRGRVVMLMMTNRPDKLDADLKRPGRFDLKLPFFFPESPDERLAILKALNRKNDLTMDGEADLMSVSRATEGYSGAELESVLLVANRFAAQRSSTSINADDLTTAVTDVIPSRDTRMLAYMELLAVFEASSKRMLPERFRDLTTQEIQAKLDALHASLGRRLH